MNTALSHRNALILSFLAGAGTLLGASLFARTRHRLKADVGSQAPAAAFADEGAHPDSFVQTRDAGPEHIRDEDGRDWDSIDQASDESFPSSDPPVANDFSTPEPIDYSTKP